MMHVKKIKKLKLRLIFRAGLLSHHTEMRMLWNLLLTITDLLLLLFMSVMPGLTINKVFSMPSAVVAEIMRFLLLAMVTMKNRKKIIGLLRINGEKGLAKKVTSGWEEITEICAILPVMLFGLAKYSFLTNEYLNRK